jgi:hypothetical protein
MQQGTTDLMVAVMRKPVEGAAVLLEQVIQSAGSIAGRPMGIRSDSRSRYEHAGREGLIHRAAG